MVMISFGRWGPMDSFLVKGIEGGQVIFWSNNHHHQHHHHPYHHHYQHHNHHHHHHHQNIITTTTTTINIIIITSTWADGGCRIVLYTWGLPRPNARLRSIQIIIRPMMIYILNKKDGEKL